MKQLLIPDKVKKDVQEENIIHCPVQLHMQVYTV
jgi:hypothetical protein